MSGYTENWDGCNPCSLADLWQRVKATWERVQGTITSINSLTPDGSGHVEMFLADLRDGGALRTEIDGIQARLNTIDSQIVAINARDNTQDSQIAQLFNEITRLDGLITGINNQLIGINGQIGALAGRVTNVEQAIVAINMQIATLVTDVNALHGRVTSLEGLVSQIQTALNNKVDKTTQANMLYATDANGVDMPISKNIIPVVIGSGIYVHYITGVPLQAPGTGNGYFELTLINNDPTPILTPQALFTELQNIGATATNRIGATGKSLIGGVEVLILAAYASTIAQLYYIYLNGTAVSITGVHSVNDVVKKLL